MEHDPRGSCNIAEPDDGMVCRKELLHARAHEIFDGIFACRMALGAAVGEQTAL